MLLQRGLKLSWGALAAVLLLSGCASTVFPDFEDDNEIIINEGGRVEVRKVNEDGVLVADKENAAYEGDEDDENVEDNHRKAAAEEEVTPVKVIEVKADEIAPVDDNVKVVEEKAVEAPEKPTVKGPSLHYLAATVYFENGGAVVDNSYKQSLRKIARLVKENDASVTVYGFASSRTRDTDPASHKLANFKVSAERAENTARALRRAGVPASKISIQALSDTAPMYQEVMPEGERLNRRAEIYLTY